MIEMHHPAGPDSVAEILTQRIRGRLNGWIEETDETTWRAEEGDIDHCGSHRWVIVATGQLAPRDPYGSRPGPLIVASGSEIEVRIQLPYVVGRDQIDAALTMLEVIDAIPAEDDQDDLMETYPGLRGAE